MTKKKGRTAAIILAGGTGKRMGTKTPKQFLKIAGKPVLIYSLQTFSKCGFISDIVVVSHKDHIKRTENLIKKHKIPKVYKVVKGGRTRQLSSHNGLKACPPDTECVLIHDAVRPLVDKALIRRALTCAKRSGAITASIDIEDSVVRANGENVEKFMERSSLKRVQTPQAFKYRDILKSHVAAMRKKMFTLTDDCSVALNAGKPVKHIKGSWKNMKITTKDDLLLVDHFLKHKYSL